MSLRSVLLSCALAMASAPGAGLAQARQSASHLGCEQTSFRIYFQRGSAALDDTARRLLAAAERQVGACAYLELHVVVDAASARAAERGQAIRAAANGRAWNVVRIERRGALQRSAHDAAPDYAEIIMTPNVGPARTHLVTPPPVGV